LEVRASNTPAQLLYQKFGFVEVGMRRGYYKDNHEAALIMTTESIRNKHFNAELKKLRTAHRKKFLNQPRGKQPG
ncbi:ribosomal-protein-alanine N-acetyltransferase, partial [Chloroflexota bacterium]